jgi:hypothetical protein
MARPMLSRRTFLRGAALGSSVALALPTLEAMLGTREADAAVGGPIFGMFFWGGGLPWHDGHGPAQAGHPDIWTPSTTGKNYVPSDLLGPLAAYQPSVVTGLTPQTLVPPTPPGQEDGHMRGFMVSMTGDRVRPEGFDHPSHTLTCLRPTLDQYVAKHPDFYGLESPRFRSLVVGVSTARFHEYGHWNNISYNGPDDLNFTIQDPGQLYDLLFGVQTDTSSLMRRGLLLDAVLEDAKSLSGRVGAADKLRIEAHMDHLNQVKNRLAHSGDACVAPGKPGPNEDLIVKTDVTGGLLAAALACNMTRVFSFMLTSPATTHVFANLGVPNDFHATVHAGAWDQVRAGILYQMQAFGTFLGKLAAVTDPNGATLLDRSVIFGLSEYGEGYQHSVAEMPCVLAGGGNGRIRRNVHVRDPGGNISKAHVTMLRGIGLDTPSFGWNGGETSESFGDILV